MIDDSDGDVFWIGSLFTSGWVAVVLLAVAIVFWIIAAQNSNECAARPCLIATQTARLIDHECVCVGVPK